ncbi:carboxylesterase family protein [Gordonia sp. PP30]|uniref:carboxylesterase/lipase family protein n=1 Tax=Gordonia sp. PP30 TaxID=2935861 RepID=UPI001FFF430E|nr:carboxylesterase family protein [Gordonia sp. PP30]UQE75886.1 carboxylesterase family protein [Gordonia sp. PP30]
MSLDQNSSDTQPVVTVIAGEIRGTTTGGISAFLGIPYAAPPTGRAAFEPPAPAEPWTGVRDATSYGPTAPQVGYPAPIAAILDNVIELGDDYLNLNVWTPDPNADGLPVMVWIHGGAFARGSNRLPMYAGDTFARDGVVAVGINYRLGVPGFGSVDGAPENRGLLDQIAALTWVRENIAAFGGDPARVTIFGESAGAMSVASLLSSPLAEGLFQQAVMESGGGHIAADPADARRVTARIAEIAGVSADVDGLASLSREALLSAQTQAALELTLNPDPAIWGRTVVDQGMGIMGVFPVLDGAVLPDVPVASIAAGAGRGVPLLAGWNADEFRFFLVPTGVAAMATPELARGMLLRSNMDTADLDARLAAGESAGDALCAALTAVAFALPTRAIAELRADSATYLFEFDSPSPVADIRAGHAVEIPFVFDHLADAERLAGPEPDQRVADDMHGAWVRFAVTGDPGWPAGEIHRFA